MKMPALTIPLLCALCTVAGFLVGKGGRASSGATESVEGASGEGGVAAVPGMVVSGSAAAEEGDEAGDGIGVKSKRVERFRKLLSVRSGRRRAFDLAETIYAMNAEELAAAWPDLEPRLGSDPDAWKLLDVYFGAWAAKDMAGATAATEKMEMWHKTQALGVIAGVLAETDVAGAIEFARQRTKPDEKTGCFDAVLTAVARGSDEEAFALLLRGVDEKLITGGMWWGATFLNLWANEDPQAAVAHALRVPDGELRNRGLQSILETWGKSAPEAALKWVEGQDDPLIQGDIMRSLVDGWSKREPEKAAAYALEKASGSMGSGILNQAIGNWAESEMEAAKAWVAKLDDPTLRDDARLALIGRLSWRDPKAAADMLLEFKDSPRVFSNLQNTTWQWARSDPEGAWAWAQKNIPEGAQRGEFLSGLVRTMSASNPEAARSHLDSIADDRSRGQAYAGVGFQFAEKDIDGALKWLNSQGDGPERDRALAGVAAAYAQKDPLKASEWLREVPVGIGRDMAVVGFVRQIADKDPAGAWEWGESITDTARRSQALETVAQTMLRQDRTTATARIRASTAISEEIKWRLLDAD